MRDIMIDIETAGDGVNAVVLSIGAVAFDIETGALGKEFYVKIDLENSLQFGRVSAGTLKWWMSQNDAVRKEAFSGRASLNEALRGLRDFFLSFGHSGRNQGKGSACVWGNGPSFDMTILETAFLRCLNEKAPWEFWNIMCCRTARRMASFVTLPKKDENVAHNALYDAKHQAQCVIMQMQAVKAFSKTPPLPAPAPATTSDDDIC